MISIKFIRGKGDKELPTIRDNLIVTEYLARLRAEAELDEVYYSRVNRRVEVPYADTTDGQVVRIEDPRISSGNFLARSVTIRIREPEITLDLSLEGEHESPE